MFVPSIIIRIAKKAITKHDGVHVTQVLLSNDTAFVLFLMHSEDPYYRSKMTLEAASAGARDLLCALGDANRLPVVFTGMLLTTRTLSSPLSFVMLVRAFMKA